VVEFSGSAAHAAGKLDAGLPPSSGHISDALLGRIHELDPDAERKTRRDGSQFIELSNGEWLPNARQALEWFVAIKNALDRGE
jgi:hypothetical protein